jgi:hypothetical protein
MKLFGEALHVHPDLHTVTPAPEHHALERAHVAEISTVSDGDVALIGQKGVGGIEV